ncbi:unnamed protein product [Cochlearia groenlandica]
MHSSQTLLAMPKPILLLKMNSYICSDFWEMGNTEFMISALKCKAKSTENSDTYVLDNDDMGKLENVRKEAYVNVVNAVKANTFQFTVEEIKS